MTVMEGAAERERRAIERSVAEAWWTANLAGAGEKLRPLKHYIDQLRPKKAQTAEDILTVFREHQARGAAIRITLIRPEEA